MKQAFYISIFLLFLSCNSKEEKTSNPEIEISENFKIVFLSKILSDTTELKLMRSTEMFLSNFDGLPPPTLPTDFKNPKKSIKHSQYIANQLGIKNVEFVEKQMKENKHMDFNKLADYGFNMLDVKGFIERGIYYSKILESTEKEKHYGFFAVSAPIFNESLDRAYLRTMDFGGETLILSKEDSKWKIDKVIDRWIE